MIQLINALLVLAGPFVVAAPLIVAVHLYGRRPSRPARFTLVVSLPRLAVPSW